MPTWLDNEPDSSSTADFFLSAFFDLSTCRAYGFSAGPIPWTAIVEYARAYGLPWESSLWFATIIRALDRVYLDHLDKKQEKKNG